MKLRCSLVLHLPPLPGFLYFVWLLTGNCSSPHFPPFPPTFVINCQLFVSSSPIMTLFKLPTPTFNSCWSELVEKLTNLIEFSIIDKISTSIHNIDFHNINFNIIWDITQCKLCKSIQPMLFNTFFFLCLENGTQKIICVPNIWGSYQVWLLSVGPVRHPQTPPRHPSVVVKLSAVIIGD